MKTLEKEIIWTGDGFGEANAITLRQVKREGRVCVYERIKKNGTHDGYEVFTVKVVEAGAPMPGGGVVAETYESYPRANSFGRTAWHLRGMPLVDQRFQELLTKQNALDSDDEEAAVALSVPVVEFTCGELAETNSITYAEAQCFIKENLDKTIKLVRTGRKEGQTRGKPSNFYVKI
jgi:hypothetical protein